MEEWGFKEWEVTPPSLSGTKATPFPLLPTSKGNGFLA